MCDAATGAAGDEGYRRRFDYTSTYELDSTVPITCIHPHWDADFYHKLEPKPFDEKDGFGSPGAAVMFTSNCKNAGAEASGRRRAEGPWRGGPCEAG